METDKLYKLTSWLSPGFPVGAYSYSHGIEAAVEAGFVRDSATLFDWTEMILLSGSGHVDAVLFWEAWEASRAGDRQRLREIADVGLAFRGTSEMALESTAQGLAFLTAVQDAWGMDLSEAVDAEKPVIAYAVAVGAACGKEQIPVAAALQMFLHALIANLVSAGIRIIPLGQTDGQRVIARHESTVHEAVIRALGTRLEDVGTSTPMVDWTSMRHETQQTRLFRS